MYIPCLLFSRWDAEKYWQFLSKPYAFSREINNWWSLQLKPLVTLSYIVWSFTFLIFVRIQIRFFLYKFHHLLTSVVRQNISVKLEKNNLIRSLFSFVILTGMSVACEAFSGFIFLTVSKGSFKLGFHDGITWNNVV